MPSPGSKLKTGNRYNALNRELHKRFITETGMEIEWSDFSNIICKSNLLIKQIILDNPQGFKTPESLGNIAITRYKSKPRDRTIDWKKTMETGVRVYHTNFHTFGYKMRIQWYMDTLAKCKNLNVYKFIPDRFFSRELARSVFSGKSYNEYSYEYFKAKKIRIGRIMDKHELQKHR